MNIIYLDCGMGAAGDMLSAALLELLPEKEPFIEKLNGLGIPGVQYQAETAVRAGITGTHMKVTVDGVEEESHDHDHDHTHNHDHMHDHGHTHHHAGMDDIAHIISHLSIPDKVKEDVTGVYRLIAEAESTVHGVPVTEIHFHEVGTLDAVADITAVCLLFHELKPDAVIASPVCTGSGSVHCAHGILPVPAPATAHLLKNIPIYSGDIQGELCTPTGAALLKYFVTEFKAMPLMTIDAIGYGMGKKEFASANCVRAVYGHDSQAASQGTDTVLELSCNIDDMTAEELSFAMDRLFEKGAKDVFTIPIGMKKSRPGILLCVICSPQDKDSMLQILFQHTSTLGVRETVLNRNILERRTETVDTVYGSIRRKISSGYGVKKIKYEYDDLSRIAADRGLTIAELKKDLPLSE